MKAKIKMLVMALLLPAGALAQETPPEPPPEEPAVRTERPSTPTMDHLELDPTTITGNRELPKVMVIVPWKRSDIGELQGRPANSLLNEILSPVDRDVFRRELRYFEALDGDGAPSSTPPAATDDEPASKPET
jgi:hypothetical protein